MMPLYPALTILLVALLPISNAAAETMSFYGTLVTRPVCTVSDKGGRMDVRFRNIAISKIDGERYRQAIPYQIDCPGASTGKTWRMRLTLTASDTSFNPAAFPTSVDGLGIKVSLNGSALIPNIPRELEINPLAPPQLEAVPVKASDATLSSVAFTASALLTAEFY